MPRETRPIKTTRKPRLREYDPKPPSRQVFPDVSYELEWRESISRLYEIAKLLTSRPGSEMVKRDLRRMLAQVWLLIPERVQLVARRDLPEKMLCGEIDDTEGGG